MMDNGHQATSAVAENYDDVVLVRKFINMLRKKHRNDMNHVRYTQQYLIELFVDERPKDIAAAILNSDNRDLIIDIVRGATDEVNPANDRRIVTPLVELKKPTVSDSDKTAAGIEPPVRSKRTPAPVNRLQYDELGSSNASGGGSGGSTATQTCVLTETATKTKQATKTATKKTKTKQSTSHRIITDSEEVKRSKMRYEREKFNRATERFLIPYHRDEDRIAAECGNEEDSSATPLPLVWLGGDGDDGGEGDDGGDNGEDESASEDDEGDQSPPPKKKKRSSKKRSLPSDSTEVSAKKKARRTKRSQRGKEGNHQQQTADSSEE